MQDHDRRSQASAPLPKRARKASPSVGADDLHRRALTASMRALRLLDASRAAQPENAAAQARCLVLAGALRRYLAQAVEDHEAAKRAGMRPAGVPAVSYVADGGRA